jgi:folate-binding Fe-S cluster repair protein YgfZ
MHYRGHPNKMLHRFVIEGSPPAPDTPIFQNEKQVGKITSIAPLPVNGEMLALGYLTRTADTQGALRAGDATLRPLA